MATTDHLTPLHTGRGGGRDRGWPRRVTLAIGVIGPGTVGGTLLDQLAGQVDRLRAEKGLDLRVRAILSRRHMLLSDEGVDLTAWRDQLAARAVPADIDRFVQHLRPGHVRHGAIVDCTASADVAGRYAEWLGQGLHVITPNKHAGSGPLRAFETLERARQQAGSYFLYEATVGAGLPIITTLRDLCETGDRIRSIDGLFSGTLAYLFDVFDGQQPFSTLVRDAQARGYCEPDPRDDLSGTDVARKLVILARECRLDLDLQDVAVESLVPPSLVTCAVDEFLERLPAHDEAIAQRLAEARVLKRVLRYVGRLTADGQATVGIEALDADHPFARGALTDNVVRFVTDRYCDNPLVIQGPGAGSGVTAGGVFGDLLRLSACLGAAT